MSGACKETGRKSFQSRLKQIAQHPQCQDRNICIQSTNVDVEDILK